MKAILLLFAIRILEGIGLGIGVFIVLTVYNTIESKIRKED